jgi:hypothetical protein
VGCGRRAVWPPWVETAKAAGDWWQFGTTAAGTRSNPNETTIGAANVAPLVVGAVAAGRAYVQVGDFESGTSALLAYGTGAFRSAPLWQQRSGCNNLSPTVHLSIVFVGAIACRPSGDDGGVRAGVFGAPAVAGGRVFAGVGANLQARSVGNGALRWNVAVAASGAPAVANGLVYAGLRQGIGAWRLSDGAQTASPRSASASASPSPATASSRS